MNIVSPYCTVGPYFPFAFSNGTSDLTRVGETAAQGTHILLTGRVLEEGGAPTFNTIVEIWQPDANGVFRSADDPNASKADPGFAGWGRARTGTDGGYSFRTVIPGSYEENGQARVPHINIMLVCIGVTRRAVTTVFFGDGSDPVLDCVKDPAARARLVAVRDTLLDRDGLPAYRFDILLRGEGETPLFAD